LRRYKQKSVKVGIFRRGWVSVSTNFRWKGALPTNHCWSQRTRVIALLRGIKISAVRCLVLSENTRVTDREMDRQTRLGLTRPCYHSCLYSKNYKLSCNLNSQEVPQ